MSSETNDTATPRNGKVTNRPRWISHWPGGVAAGLVVGSGSHLMGILGYWLSTTSFGPIALSLA